MSKDRWARSRFAWPTVATVLAAVAVLCGVAPPLTGAAGSGGKQSVHEIRIPESPWKLVMDLPGFSVVRKFKPGYGYGEQWYATRKADVMYVYISIDRGSQLDSAVKCRDIALGRMQGFRKPPKEFSFSETDSVSLTRYWTASQSPNPRVKERHIVATFCRDKVCVNVHVFGVVFNPADEEIVENVARSITVRK